MSYNIFIVESPSKCEKIENYLGPGNKCIASYGHFRELVGLQSIDFHNNFNLTFMLSESKQSQVNKIRKYILGAKEVFLATDDDREGEAIAWHICDYYKLPIKTTKRIVFHEVTESALKRSLLEYRYVNMKLVHAQLCRQVLDIMVGYKLSPILWKNIKGGTSAGRCQTPALRLIYDNYKEIQESPGKKEYNITGYFTGKNIPFVLNYDFVADDEKIKYTDSTNISTFLKESIDFKHIYSFDDLRDCVKEPPDPFTTSRLQQSASTNLHTSPKETMRICQKLYEEGYITYMRTDSSIYSREFIDNSISYITYEHGADFVRPDISTLYDSESASATAHEAIRPTSIYYKSLDVNVFSSKEIKMYELIWSNAIESCMSPARYKGLTANITAPQNHKYKFSTEKVVFPGWKVINGFEETNKEFIYLQTLKENSIVNYKKITAKTSLKELKSHYTEAKLVQLLEKKGIGRPSTFSSLIDKIQERGYVKKENVKGLLIKCIDYELNESIISMTTSEREFGNEKNKLVIKPLGIMVLEYLLGNFNDLFDYDYTKHMEEQLDEISKGNKVWYELCKECLTTVDKSIKCIDSSDKGKEYIRVDSEHMYMMGKYGPVLKCTSLEEKDEDNNPVSRSNSLVTFKAVKPDIDLDKLRNGEYTLKDMLLDPDSDKAGRSLGIYKTKEVFLKSGKFGWYIEWGTEKKALKLTLIEATALTLDDVSDTLFDIENGESAIIREVSKETSIRKGKYGDYIFHKNKKMKKPKFLKLEGFTDDYKTCDIEVIHTWLKKKYDINK